MKLVSNAYIPNFKSRNVKIREADNLVRLSNRIFPAVSSSKTKARATNFKKFSSLHEKIAQKIGENVRCYSSQPDSLARAMLIGSAMRKFKVGNCAEMSRITNLICKVNGIDALPFKFMVERQGRVIELDHMALIYPLKSMPKESKSFAQSKDFIIIDPWLGFADYASRAQERYNKDFHNLLNIGVDEKLIIDPRYISYTDKLHNKDVELLKDRFPAWFKSFLLPKNLQK